MKQDYFIHCGESLYSPSSLLIPSYLLDKFNDRLLEFGSLQKLFHYMANRKHRVFLMKSRSMSGRTRFQPPGVFIRKDFYPFNEDWEKFRLLACFLRMSMTLLFSLMLMDWEGFDDEGCTVPTYPQYINLFISMKITRTAIYLQYQALLL